MITEAEDRAVVAGENTEIVTRDDADEVRHNTKVVKIGVVIDDPHERAVEV